MTDYISREALLERIDGIWDCADMVFEPNDKCCRTDDCASCKWRETKNAIRKIAANIPAADVRPVVYCKDCVHYVRGELFGDMVCDYHYRHHYHMEENDFCSKADKSPRAEGAEMEEQT